MPSPVSRETPLTVARLLRVWTGFAVDQAASLSGLLIFGSYLSGNPLATFPLPVLHLVGTLDGGQARPTRMAQTYTELEQLQVRYGHRHLSRHQTQTHTEL